MTNAGSDVIVTTVDDLDEGAMLADKYRIVRVLGRGGMGVVVEAEHVQLGERVAIKFLAADHMQNREARERFAREARAVVKLRSDHVARVRDVGELSTGQPYIVMELMTGQDLARTLEAGAMSPERIVDLMLQACEALAEAHAAGIVHRDVKPANMFITQTIDGSPQLKLLDFGVATAPTADVQITSSGVVVGTPAFMCPEQMRSSRQAEPRWDIWSLGVVLYDALEHELPFRGEGFAELAVAVLTEPPQPMRHTPAGLRDVVRRCLEKEPEARYGNVAELAVALAPYAGTAKQAEISIARTTRLLGVSVARASAILPPRMDTHPTIELAPSAPRITAASEATPPPSVPPLTTSPSRVAAPSLDSIPPVRAPRRWVAILAALLLLGLAAIVGFWAIRARRGASAPLVDAGGDLGRDAGPDASTGLTTDAAVAAPPGPADAMVTTPPDAATTPEAAPTDATPPSPPHDARRPGRDHTVPRTTPADAGPTPGPDASDLSEQDQMKGRT